MEEEIWYKKIIKSHPLLYEHLHYFECLSGWEVILTELSDVLEEEIEKYNKDNLDCESHCYASQVKEKYGGLRFYMGAETEKMSKLIQEAEAKSYNICEKCGKEGAMNNGPWYEVRCTEHKRD